MNPSCGGPSQGIRNSIPELARLGVHNEVVCLDDPGAPYLSNDTFPIHAIGVGKGASNYNAELIPWLLGNFSHFDAVIVHGLWLYHSHAVQKALKLYKRRLLTGGQNKSKTPKLFVMPHGMLDPYFQKTPNRRFKAVRNWIYWKLIECRVINQADGIFFTCEEELLLARTTFWPYKPKLEINIGYGIPNPSAYTSILSNAFLARCPEVKGRPYFLFLSRIHEKKGVDLLIKAYTALLAANLEAESYLAYCNTASRKVGPFPAGGVLPVLVVAGPGLDTAYGRQIRRLAAALPAAAVYFPGMLTGDAKWGAFYGCEAFVLPSHQENFGIAVAEALACGKPVLISNQVNIWREIAAGGGGTVEDDTLPGTQRLLQGWCRLTQDQKQAMSNCALATYRQHFAIEGAAQKMAAALQ